MSRRPRASIVIPAHNESAALDSVLAGFAPIQGDHQIIVINDGSTDRTREILEKVPMGLTVIHHEERRGYGASLMSGIREADSDIIVTFDADGQHDHHDVFRLLDEMHDCAMVVGARTSASYFAPSRTAGRWLLLLIANLWTGARIPDINSGLRAFRKKVAMRYETLLPSGFSFSTTLTLAMMKEKYAVRFVPIVARRPITRSTLRLIDGLRVFRGILRLMMLFHLSGRLSAKAAVPAPGQESSTMSPTASD